MLGLPELDRHPEGRHRKHAAPLHPRSGRGAGGLTSPGGHGQGRAGPLILALDAAGSSCSVAIAAGDDVLGLAQLETAHGQAEALLPLVDRSMRQVSLPASAVELVAVTTGPGSFTGIRVGIAAARGISLGLGVPLIGVTVFEAVAATVRDAGRERRFLLVALDSRRADLYVQLFDRARCPLGGPVAVLPAALAEMVRAEASEHALAVAGDAAERAAAALAAGGVASVVLDGEPPALGALRAALRRWRHGEQHQGEQDSPVRPLYLRSPDVTLAAAPVPPGRL